jgi:hypothetical protein
MRRRTYLDPREGRNRKDSALAASRLSIIGLGVLGTVALASGAIAQELVTTPRGPGFLIYGNYCGPGNRGPRYRPIDALDRACAHHDACWPADPGVLPACTCNERLHVEAGLVARDPHAPAKTRETAQFISDFATAIPCDGPGGPGIAAHGLPQLPGGPETE